MSKTVYILVELPIEQAVELESIVGDIPYHEYIEKLVAERIAAQHRVQSDWLSEPACCASFVFDGTHHRDCRMAQPANR